MIIKRWKATQTPQPVWCASPDLWLLFCLFPPLRFALIVSHVLPLSSSLFDSHVHWLTSSTNGWQMAVRLRAEKCAMPGVTPLFYVTSFKPHSISSVKWLIMRIYCPHTWKLQQTPMRTETAHLSAPHPVHLGRGLACSKVSTMSN